MDTCVGARRAVAGKKQKGGREEEKYSMRGAGGGWVRSPIGGRLPLFFYFFQPSLRSCTGTTEIETQMMHGKPVIRVFITRNSYSPSPSCGREWAAQIIDREAFQNSLIAWKKRNIFPTWHYNGSHATKKSAWI